MILKTEALHPTIRVSTGPLHAVLAPVAVPFTSEPEIRAPNPRTREAAPVDVLIPSRPARPGLTPGQWDPEQGDIARREVERISQQSYLQNFWYCVMSGVDAALPAGQLAEARVMGKSIAFWRAANGEVRAISNICSHRGAQLSKGWLDTVDGESCVRCPYHAWAFNGDGCVKHIPVQPDGRFPKRSLQESFATTVRDGQLWMFWGSKAIPEEDRCPLPTAHHTLSTVATTASEPRVRVQHNSAEHLQPHWLTFKQLVPEARITAVAQKFLGVSCTIISASDTIDTDAFSATSQYSLQVDSRHANLLMSSYLPPFIPVTVTMHLPSSMTVSFDLGEGRRLSLESHVQPRTFDSCTVHASLSRNFALWPGSNVVAQDMLDNWVEGERSRTEGVTMPKSWRLPSTVLHRAFSKLRHAFVLMGYGVPPETAIQHHRSDM